jgi:NAD-dependent deacetylase
MIDLGFKPVGDERIVILTGAGISRESGLSTFRDADGIWAQYKPEDVATPEGFARDPALVLDFYNQRRRHLLSGEVEPNPAHDALARLERDWPHEVLIVTQNIDDLHERAGSKNVIHMHGEILKARCTGCNAVIESRFDLALKGRCPHCRAIGTLRPDVVWFGEFPYEMERIFQALGGCGLFVSIGTSSHVQPAASFVEIVRDLAGAHTIELNLEPSERHESFAASHHGKASAIVPAFVDALLATRVAKPGRKQKARDATRVKAKTRSRKK